VYASFEVSKWLQVHRQGFKTVTLTTKAKRKNHAYPWQTQSAASVRPIFRDWAGQLLFCRLHLLNKYVFPRKPAVLARPPGARKQILSRIAFELNKCGRI
jgi:hypothetical protein